MLFQDDLANVVYITDALQRYPKVYDAMRVALASHHIEVRPIVGTKNIWCRDYMPTQIEGNRFVKFNYKGYGTPDAVSRGLAYNDYPQLVVPEECWTGLGHVRMSDIVLDVGNVSRRGSKAVVTEIIFRHNPQYQPQKLIAELESLLEAQLVLVPVEPGDDLGHADGILKWIDDTTVFINDTTVMEDEDYDAYTQALTARLGAYGITAVPFTYAYDLCPEIDEAEFRRKYPDADDLNPGYGYYVNFLQVDGLILLPFFGIPRDEEAAALVRQYYPHSDCVGIDCADLSMEGGLLNCTTISYMA